MKTLFWLGSPQDKELYESVITLGRVRTIHQGLWQLWNYQGEKVPVAWNMLEPGRLRQEARRLGDCQSKVEKAVCSSSLLTWPGCPGLPHLALHSPWANGYNVCKSSWSLSSRLVPVPFPIPPSGLYP